MHQAGVQKNYNILFASIAVIISVVTSHAVYWGGLKSGVWSGIFKSVTFNWVFNFILAAISCAIVLSGIRYTLKKTENIGRYQAAFILNGMQFSVVIPFIIPVFIMAILFGAVDTILLALLFSVCSITILSIPAIYKRNTVQYLIYAIAIIVIAILGVSASWMMYISKGFLTDFFVFVSKIRWFSSNPFQYLSIQHMVPIAISILITTLIIPSVAIGSVLPKK